MIGAYAANREIRAIRWSREIIVNWRFVPSTSVYSCLFPDRGCSTKYGINERERVPGKHLPTPPEEPLAFEDLFNSIRDNHAHGFGQSPGSPRF